MTLAELISLYHAVSDEAEEILNRVHDNGRTTLKPGSPALAVLYGYEEVVQTLFRALCEMQQDVREAVEL